MTEYRVVADIEKVSKEGTRQYIAQTPWHHGRMQLRGIITDRKVAETYLREMQEECPKHDQQTREKYSKGRTNYFYMIQSNIRIQSREVSEWEDERLEPID